MSKSVQEFNISVAQIFELLSGLKCMDVGNRGANGNTRTHLYRVGRQSSYPEEAKLKE